MQTNQLFNHICSDLDGSLITTQKQVGAYSRKVMRHIYEQKQAIFTLASGRMPASIVKVYEELGIEGSVAAYNGAMTYLSIDDVHANRPIMNLSISAHIARAIFDCVTSLIGEKHVSIYIDNEWFVSECDYWCIREVRTTKVWPIVTDLKQLLDNTSHIHKLFIRGDAEILDKVAKVAAEMEESSAFIAFRIAPTLLDFTPKKASKGDALAAIQQHTGTTAKQTIAFGDSGNDVDMIKYAGNGVAMSNALDEIKALAQEMTLSNNEDGVGYMLAKYFHYHEF